MLGEKESTIAGRLGEHVTASGSNMPESAPHPFALVIDLAGAYRIVVDIAEDQHEFPETADDSREEPLSPDMSGCPASPVIGHREDP